MASLNLSNVRSRHDYFQQGILTNLRYWQRWLPEHQADVAAMDRERDPLLRAIGFALELGAPAWPAVYELILALAPWMERRGYWDARAKPSWVSGANWNNSRPCRFGWPDCPA